MLRFIVMMPVSGLVEDPFEAVEDHSRGCAPRELLDVLDDIRIVV
jgi:hypothetical protein